MVQQAVQAAAVTQPSAVSEALRQQLVSLPASEIIALLQCLDPQVLKAALRPKIPSADGSADKRRAPRNRTLRTGKIIYNNQMCVIDCLIRDISLTGCRVRVPNPGMIPDRFALQGAADGDRRNCTVSWRTADELGLKFLD